MDPEKLFIDEIRARIDSYYGIVLRNIRDSIPKLIGTFLVKAIQDRLQFVLHNEINSNEEILDQLNEVIPSIIKISLYSRSLLILLLKERPLTKSLKSSKRPNSLLVKTLSTNFSLL